MNDKVLLDTNILIYAFDSSSEFHKICLKIINKRPFNITTYNCLLEFYRVVTSRPFQNTINKALALEAFEYLSTTLEIIYPTNTTQIILSNLLNEHDSKSGNIFDIGLYAQAVENNISKIYTKNIKDFFVKGEIAIIDPTI